MQLPVSRSSPEMESFFLILASITLILCSSISLVFFLRRNPSTGSRKLPPGSNGWPIIGESLHFTRPSPQKFISERMEKYSNRVFRTSLLGEKMAAFCGPEGNKFLFSNMNKLITVWWPPSILNPLIAQTSGDDYIRESSLSNRAFLNDQILKVNTLKHHIPVMDYMSRQQLETYWRPYSEVIKVYPLVQKYTFALACRIFLGIDDPGREGSMAEAFELVRLGLVSVPINFPGTAYSRAMKGGRIVREEFIKIIRERKNEVMEGTENVGWDFLSQMLRVTDENGRFMSEIEICNMILGLLIASHDTTSSGITFILKYLARFPHIYDKVCEEQMEIAKSKGPGELLNWEDIQKMKYSWNVACEAFRLTPPTLGGFKEALSDFTYEGFTIPKGWKILWSVHSTQRDPKYFKNPDDFDPSRFEGSGPEPYTFVPFGGGPRMCPGKEFARLELLVFIHNVVTRFKLQDLATNEEIVYASSPSPKNGFPARIVPHEKTLPA